MTTAYRVTWVIDIDADTPREAAEKALEIQRDPQSIATHFIVRAVNSIMRVEIDLSLDPSIRT